MKALDDKSTDELLDLAFRCLTELKARQEKKVVNVTFKQSKEALVLEKGIPADRKDWLYLPFLNGVSQMFQPQIEADGKVYHNFFGPGTKLQLSGTGKGESVEILDKGPEQTVEVGGAFITGPLKIIRRAA